MDGFHEESYDAFLKSELERLFESLVQQHQAVVEKVRASESPAKAAAQSPQSPSRLGSALRKRSKESEISTANGAHSSVASFPNSEASSSGGPIHNWGLLTRNLIERHHEEFEESESEDDQQMSYAKDILSLRPAWKGVLHQNALKREKTKTFNMSPLHKLHRMQDSETEEGCLQAFVRPPSSKIQILWSLIGSLLIVWDLITIPLELFDVQSLINFLVQVGRFSFAFWVVDVPLHAIFGVEIDGHLELRPRVLMRRYIRSWLPIDVLVLSIDAALIVLQEIQNAQPEGSPVRSARYLRTLRLLRLLRLLRVAKLQQELTLLANNFLSTYAFMVMKVVSGLLMILAVNHILACCWYGLGRWTLENGQSWLINAGIEEADMADAYAADTGVPVHIVSDCLAVTKLAHRARLGHRPPPTRTALWPLLGSTTLSWVPSHGKQPHWQHGVLDTASVRKLNELADKAALSACQRRLASPAFSTWLRATKEAEAWERAALHRQYHACEALRATLPNRPERE